MSLRNHLVRGSLALFAGLSLAACGGGGTSEPTSNAAARVFMDGPFTVANPFYVQGVGDGYAEGVTLELWQDGEYLRNVVTDQDGEALIGGLAPQTLYHLRMYFSDPGLQNAADTWFGLIGWDLSGSDIGGDDSRDSDAIKFNDGGGNYGRIKFTSPPEGEVVDTLAFGLSDLGL